MRQLIKKFKKAYLELRLLNSQLLLIRESLGRIESKLNESKPQSNLSEFKVFSQWGEDGIIQSLVSRIEGIPKCFVEFGVEDYTEANTRFLARNNYWSGLVIDGCSSNLEKIKSDSISWSNNINSVCKFITAENINCILQQNLPDENVGLLSIDIDGNDYWVWKSITCIDPPIVICEYNSHFGPHANVTIPYDPNFTRSMHPSNIFYGASITALTNLAHTKGYKLVYGNQAGNNLFFVKANLLPSVPEISITAAYRQSQFREHKDSYGQLSFIPFSKRVLEISNELIFDLDTSVITKFKNIVNHQSHD